MNPSLFFRVGVLGTVAASLILTHRAAGAELGEVTKRLSVVPPQARAYVVHGPAVSAKGPRLTFIAQIDDFRTLREAYAGREVRAAGNFLSFWEGGLHVTVENLPPKEYALRLEAMEAGTAGAYCHDAVSYEPVTRNLSDPYGVLEAPEPCVDPLVSLEFSSVLRGYLAAAGGWAHSSAFLTEKERVLAASPRDRAEARAVVTDLLQHIVALSENVPAAELRNLVTSNLVSASLVLHDGRSSLAMTEAAAELRRSHGEIGAGVRWLAVLVGPGARTGEGPSLAVGSADPYAAELTRLALPQALALLDSPVGSAIPVPGTGLPTQSYAQWLTAFGDEATPAHSDRDRDGLSALVEYGLGLDPENFSREGAPRLSEGAEDGARYLALNYTRDLTKTDIRYQVETSATLEEGSWTTEGVLDVAAGNGSAAHLQPRQARVVRDGERRFLRLRIVESK